MTASACVLLASCAATRTAQSREFRSFFLPPSPAVPAAVVPITDGPELPMGVYAKEAPNFASSLTVIPRVTDTDFILRRAEDRFNAGKKAIQDGRTEDARAEFDKAVDVLLAAPEDTAERGKLDKRLQEMVDEIYRYDTDELGAGEDADAESDSRPIDEALEMTFPIDPSLRNKVQEQIRATASQLPLEESDAVISYINYFSSPRGKQILESGLRRSGRYKAMIKKILAEEGLPQELIFLAQAESGFVPRAVSNKLCVGLWQFAKFRGEEYGLTVNSTLDERMDPEKATRAAAHHLHDLYKHLGDWYLAMAAYDCGPNCVDHAVERTGYADFWALRRMNALPKETANYVPVILAMIIVSENAKDYGLDDIQPDSPLQYETVSVESPTSLALVSAAVDRPLAELKDLNPALLNQTAPTGYRLRIPTGTRDELDQAFAAVPSSQRDNWRLHRVESGDTVSTLARQYGVSAKQVLEANHGELPEAGSFAAIPVGYPAEHVRGRHSSSRRHRTTAKESSPHPAKASPVAHKSTKHKTARHPAIAEEGKGTSGRKPAAPGRAPGA